MGRLLDFLEVTLDNILIFGPLDGVDIAIKEAKEELKDDEVAKKAKVVAIKVIEKSIEKSIEGMGKTY